MASVRGRDDHFAFAGYGLVQQALRTGADDPQIQLAEDAARALTAGALPTNVVPSPPFDAGLSLAPFLIVLDAQGGVVAANATLDGAWPVPPRGVLDVASVRGQNRLTWQPRSGVRFATVVRPIGAPGSGWVVAARSLREVEEREDRTLAIAFLAWTLALGGSLLAIAFGELMTLRPRRRR